MGIDTLIRKWLRDRVTPEAWSIQLRSGRGLVVIEDLLIALMSTQYSPALAVMTGEQMFHQLWLKVHKVMMNDEATGYVIVVDDKPNVDAKHMKSRVHIERKAAKMAAVAANDEKQRKIAEKKSKETGVFVQPEKDLSQTPYPADFVIRDTERFDIRRLLAGDRRKIWAYLTEKLKGVQIPDSKLVIFEYDKLGPWVFTNGTSRQATEMAHDHGEFDVSLLYYLCYFAKHPIRVVTTDTDVIPIIIGYLVMLKAQKKTELTNPSIDWVYTNQEGNPIERFGATKAPYYVVDMLKMARIIPARLDMALETFILGCYLSGTDHFDKKLICHGYGFATIMESIKLCSRAVALRDQIPKPGLGSKRYLYTFHRLLVSTTIRTMAAPADYLWDSDQIVLYGPKCINDDHSMSLSPDELSRSGAVQPTEAKFQEAFVQLTTNLRYWCVDWQEYAPLHDRTQVTDYFSLLPPDSVSSLSSSSAAPAQTGMKRFFPSTAKPAATTPNPMQRLLAMHAPFKSSTSWTPPYQTPMDDN
jgi:hypothetical protein